MKVGARSTLKRRIHLSLLPSRPSIRSLIVALGLVISLLLVSLVFRNATDPDLTEGAHPAPEGSLITLKVDPITENGLTVGQKARFNYSVSYVLNAKRGQAKVILQISPDKCSWLTMSSTFDGGSGTLFNGFSHGFEALPDTTEIRFVALLAEEGQSETSTKAIVSLPVSPQAGKSASTITSPCNS